MGQEFSGDRAHISKSRVGTGFFWRAIALIILISSSMLMVASLQPMHTVAQSIARPQIAAIELFKSGVFNDENGDGYASPGESISYELTVQNRGNVDLTNVRIGDSQLTISNGSIEKLAVGISRTFSISYIITPEDVALEHVGGSATVLGSDPDGNLIRDLSDDPDDPTNADLNKDGNPDDPTILRLIVPVIPKPEINLLLSAQFSDENGDGYASLGESIRYEFTVQNRGNVDLTKVTVYDSLSVVNGGPLATLWVAAGDSATFSSLYKLKQSDINNRGIDNSATVTAEDPDGNLVSDLSDDPNIIRDLDPNQDGNPDDQTLLILDFYAPTAIVLTSFTTQLNDSADKLILRWTTGAEINTYGFHILRRDINTHNAVQFVTDQAIVSQGPAGGSYEISISYDPTVDPAPEQLAFWLYEEEVTGNTNYYGPAEIILASANLEKMQSTYLPAISQ